MRPMVCGPNGANQPEGDDCGSSERGPGKETLAGGRKAVCKSTRCHRHGREIKMRFRCENRVGTNLGCCRDPALNSVQGRHSRGNHVLKEGSSVSGSSEPLVLEVRKQRLGGAETRALSMSWDTH